MATRGHTRIIHLGKWPLPQGPCGGGRRKCLVGMRSPGKPCPRSVPEVHMRTGHPLKSWVKGHGTRRGELNQDGASTIPRVGRERSY